MKIEQRRKTIDYYMNELEQCRAEILVYTQCHSEEDVEKSELKESYNLMLFAEFKGLFNFSEN